MKIRTVEELYDFLSEEMAWRKRELHSLRLLIKDSKNTGVTKNALIRSTVTMTYAHWEGFIKAGAMAYINFVAMQRLKYRELSVNFLALSAQALMNSARQSHQIEQHIMLVKFFSYDLDGRSSNLSNYVVSTESNISSTVLNNLIVSLGLDYSAYEINEKLLKSRNMIAHGEYLLMDEESVSEMQESIIGLMETFRTQIDNAAATGTYRNALAPTN